MLHGLIYLCNFVSTQIFDISTRNLSWHHRKSSNHLLSITHRRRGEM